jgi:hypothetical protein
MPAAHITVSHFTDSTILAYEDRHIYQIFGTHFLSVVKVLILLRQLFHLKTLILPPITESSCILSMATTYSMHVTASTVLPLL